MLDGGTRHSIDANDMEVGGGEDPNLEHMHFVLDDVQFNRRSGNLRP